MKARLDDAVGLVLQQQQRLVEEDLLTCSASAADTPCASFLRALPASQSNPVIRARSIMVRILWSHTATMARADSKLASATIRPDAGLPQGDRHCPVGAPPSARIFRALWERRPRRESFGPRAGLPQGDRHCPVGAPPPARIFRASHKIIRPEGGPPTRRSAKPGGSAALGANLRGPPKKPSARGGPPTEERHPDHEPPPTGRPAVRGAHPTPARPSERVAYHASSSLRSCRLLEELPSGQSDDDEVARIGRANPCVVASRRNEVPRGTAPLAGS